MKVQALKETTADLLPHVYYVNDDGKLAAFEPVGGERVVYTKPMKFEKRYRKFEKLGTVEL